VPGLLLIGSGRREAGKTELACRILRRFAARFPLVGVKVTPIDPEGGEGGPIFEGPFRLSEEDGRIPGKDTSRLLAAGARRVLWLRVRRPELRAGLRALREKIGPGALVVAESSSLRALVDPDLFLMLQRPGPRQPKPAAGALAGFADRLVGFDGAGFDLDLAALDIAGGRWQLREPASAIVLAGGRSRRLGIDKSTLTIDGVRLIERVVGALRPHVREVLIGAADPARPELAGARTVVDRQPGLGPLMGLASCLAVSRSDRNLVAACDLPEIPAVLIERLLEEALCAEVSVPREADGNLEPLLAVYRRRLLPDIEHLLERGERRIRPLYSAHRVAYVELRALGLPALPNLNTPQDLAAFIAGRNGGPGRG